MKKRALSTAAAAVSVLMLAGCGGGPAGDGGGSGELATGPGFDGKTITVGVLNPISGQVGAAAGLPTLAAIQMRVDRINAQGGIAGQYPIELEVQDSEYNPQVAVTAYEGMVSDVVLFAGVLGVGVVGAIAPSLAADDMLAFPLANEAAYVRNPNLLMTTGSYQTAFINGMDWLSQQDDTAGAVTCMIRQDDPTGEAAATGANFAADALGVDIVEDIVFPRETSDFTGQVQRLQRANCDVVVWGASATFAPGVISAAVQLDYAPSWLSITPGVPLFLMGTPSEQYVADNFVVAAAGAQWGDTTVPGMAEFMEDFEEFADPDTNPDAALMPAGYANAIAMEKLLEEGVSRGDLSPAGLLEISQSEDFTVDFGDLFPTATFGDPASRNLPTEVNIWRVDASVDGFLRIVDTIDSQVAQDFQKTI